MSNSEDILLLSERINNTIEVGESHFSEFKSAYEGKPGNKKPRLVKHICQDIAEALVSFANADGGDVLIGVEDNGIITGVPHHIDDIEIMLNAVKSHVYKDQILPLVNVNVVSIDDKKVLYFSVLKGTTMIYQLPDGRCVKRKEKATMPESINNIQFERQEVRSREYDNQFVDGATLNDLDLTMLQGIADQYIRGLSIEKYLQQVGLAQYGQKVLKLKKAALLLFAVDIDKWHPRSQVRFLKVKGNILESGEKYNVISDESIKGNIFELVFKSWEQLRPYLAYKTEFGANAQFEQKYTYPEDACREAIINAIAHRDYSIQNGIEIFIFDDRMEIKSPGALLSTLSVDNLYSLEGSHESRNSLIARVLRENKFMRELGEGMKRIFDLMQAQELEKPQLYSNGTWFSVTLKNKPIFSQKQMEWLANFQDFDLTKNQKQIILLGIGDNEISRYDIFKAMNTNDRDTYDKEVKTLREKGLLIEIRSNYKAGELSKKQNIPKNRVPRFKVVQL